MTETQTHLSFLLQNAQAGLFDSDAATSIVQVEIATTRDQLDRLLKTIALLPDADRCVQVLNRTMRDLETVAKSYVDLGDWSRSTLISFADVLRPASKDQQTALALQWKGVTDLFSELLTSRLHVVQAMAMVMPSEGFALLSLLERVRTTSASGVPPITERVQSFETDAAKFLLEVERLTNEFPLGLISETHPHYNNPVVTTTKEEVAAAKEEEVEEDDHHDDKESAQEEEVEEDIVVTNTATEDK